MSRPGRWTGCPNPPIRPSAVAGSPLSCVGCASGAGATGDEVSELALDEAKSCVVLTAARDKWR
jgi:hypothetical protein